MEEMASDQLSSTGPLFSNAALSDMARSLLLVLALPQGRTKGQSQTTFRSAGTSPARVFRPEIDKLVWGLRRSGCARGRDRGGRRQVCPRNGQRASAEQRLGRQAAGKAACGHPVALPPFQQHDIFVMKATYWRKRLSAPSRLEQNKKNVFTELW